MLLREDYRDPRITRTRRLLADALESLLGEKPFDQVTVGAITSRAMVNWATFYAHFTDKQAMAADLFHERFAELIQRRVQPTAQDHEAVLRGLILSLTDHWVGSHQRCLLTYRRFEREVEAQAVEFLNQWLTEWLARQPRYQRLPRQRLAHVAALLSGALYNLAATWRKQQPGLTAEQLADEAVILLSPILVNLTR